MRFTFQSFVLRAGSALLGVLATLPAATVGLAQDAGGGSYFSEPQTAPRPLDRETFEQALPIAEPYSGDRYSGRRSTEPSSPPLQTPAPQLPPVETQLPPVETATFEMLPPDRPANEALPHQVADEPQPLAPKGEARTLPRPGGEAEGTAAPSAAPGLFTIGGSLVLVLGLFLGVAWVMRRGMPNKLSPLSSDVLEVLGRQALAARNQMHLIRLGNKLILVSVTPTGAETLSEISDPAEVERLSAICSRSNPGSISASFRNVLSQVTREGESGGKLDLSAEGEAGRRPGSLLPRRSGKESRHV